MAYHYKSLGVGIRAVSEILSGEVDGTEHAWAHHRYLLCQCYCKKHQYVWFMCEDLNIKPFMK